MVDSVKLQTGYATPCVAFPWLIPPITPPASAVAQVQEAPVHLAWTHMPNFCLSADANQLENGVKAQHTRTVGLVTGRILADQPPSSTNGIDVVCLV